MSIPSSPTRAAGKPSSKSATEAGPSENREAHINPLPGDDSPLPQNGGRWAAQLFKELAATQSSSCEIEEIESSDKNGKSADPPTKNSGNNVPTNVPTNVPAGTEEERVSASNENSGPLTEEEEINRINEDLQKIKESLSHSDGLDDLDQKVRKVLDEAKNIQIDMDELSDPRLQQAVLIALENKEAGTIETLEITASEKFLSKAEDKSKFYNVVQSIADKHPNDVELELSNIELKEEELSQLALMPLRSLNLSQCCFNFDSSETIFLLYEALSHPLVGGNSKFNDCSVDGIFKDQGDDIILLLKNAAISKNDIRRLIESEESDEKKQVKLDQINNNLTKSWNAIFGETKEPEEPNI